MQYVKYFASFQFIEKLGSGKYKLDSKNGKSEEYDFLIWAGHPFDLPKVIHLRVLTIVRVRGTRYLESLGRQVLLTIFLFEMKKQFVQKMFAIYTVFP